jgi:hypothetical protein
VRSHRNSRALVMVVPAWDLLRYSRLILKMNFNFGRIGTAAVAEKDKGNDTRYGSQKRDGAR